MGVKNYARLREDVFRPEYDERLAPELHEIVLGTAPEIYRDPAMFFARTYLTKTIRSLLEEVGRLLAGGSGRNVHVLVSLFGGGKTHALITLYHALRSPGQVGMLEEGLEGLYRGLGQVEVVVVSGKTDRLAPSPATPLETEAGVIRTLWGYVAHVLGRYGDVESYDEQLLCPGQDVVEDLLRGRKVVFLIDELAEYVKRINALEAPWKAGYLDNVVSFIGYLAGAVVNTGNVMVVTFPGWLKGSSLQFQEGYEQVYGYLSAMAENVWRVSGLPLPPIADVRELHGVLRKRLFEHVDLEGAGRDVKGLARKVEEYRDVFGERSGLEEAVMETYPFHPAFMRVLQLIVEKVSGQYTRSAVKVSRIALRTLYGSEENPVLVMPYHMDPEYGLKALMFGQELYMGYQSIYENDVRARTRGLDKSQLAYRVALTLFLATYPYDSPRKLQAFPDIHELAFMVYEPAFFEANNYIPPDILDVVEKLQDALRHLYHDEERTRYWFYRVATIREWIESEARRLLEDRYDFLQSDLAENYVRKLLLGEYRVLEHRGERVVETRPVTHVSVFSRDNSYVDVTAGTVEVPDTPSYKLVAVLLDEPPSIRRLVLKKPRGGDRIYKNTVVVATVPDPATAHRLVELVARVQAAENVERRIDELYRGMDKEVRSLQKSMANSYRNRIKTHLYLSIVSAFSKAYYPAVSNGNATVNTVSLVSARSIAGRVVETLKQDVYGKILERIGYETLADHLERAGTPIVRGRGKSVGDIKSLFKTNPLLPMVRDVDVEDALKNGVEKLHIGIVDDMGHLHFKKIYRADEAPARTGGDKGVPPPTLSDSYTVIHWRDAVETLYQQLMQEAGEERRGDVFIITKFRVLRRGQEYPLEGLRELENWEEILRYGIIVKEVKQVHYGFLVKPEPSLIRLRRGERKTVKVEVAPLGRYREEVSLVIPSFARLEGPAKGVPPFRTTLVIDGSLVPEPGTYVIRGYDVDGREAAGTLRVELESNIVSACRPAEIGVGDKLLYVKSGGLDTLMLDGLARLADLGEASNFRVVGLEARIGGARGSSNVTFTDTDLKIAVYAVKQLMNMLGATTISGGSFEIDARGAEVSRVLHSLLSSLLRHNLEECRIKVEVEKPG